MPSGAARDPVGSVPLTLVTGPANAAKAGAVLERLRALRAQRSPARGADVGRRGPLPARAGGGGDRVRRGGADLPRGWCARSPRAAGVRGARRSGRSRATGWCARRSATRTCGCSAPSARAPGFAARGRRAVRRAAALARRRRRASRARCAAGRRRARRPRTPRSSPRCTPPTTGGWRRSAARDEQGHARAALDALRERARRAGAPGRCSSTASTTSTPLQLDAVETLAGRAEAEVWVALPYEAGARGVRRPRRDRRAAQAARRAPRRARGPLRALRRAAPAGRCTTSSGGCSRAAASRARPTAPCGCWRRAASARRPSWWPPRCSS